MHILYIHQYFHTPEESGATRSYWFAKKLLREGHKVTMITATNKRNIGDCQKNIDGIDVIFVNNYYSQKLSKLQKIKSFIKFMRKSYSRAARVKNVDLVFATSTPLTVGFSALCLHWFKKKKYVFEVRDLWPEFPIQIGAIKNKFIIHILKWIERKIYSNAEHIIALSPGMQEGVLSCGVSASKVTMIPNMSKPDLFYPREKSKDIVELLNLDQSKLNVIHFGAMGEANGLYYILEAAKIAKEKGITNIHFYVVGDGATLPKLKAESNKNQLNNISFPGHFNLYDISEIVNCCDVSIVSFKNLPILYTNSPNKLFDSLSAGKLIIVNSAGWTKELVENHNCGYYVNPEDPNALIDVLMNVDVNSSNYKLMCANSRKISKEIYDKEILCEDFYRVITNV